MRGMKLPSEVSIVILPTREPARDSECQEKMEKNLQ
jgi:hypothetical protein